MFMTITAYLNQLEKDHKIEITQEMKKKFIWMLNTMAMEAQNGDNKFKDVKYSMEFLGTAYALLDRISDKTRALETMFKTLDTLEQYGDYKK